MDLPGDVTWTDLLADGIVLFLTFFVALTVISALAPTIPGIDAPGLTVREAAGFGFFVALVDLAVTVVRLSIRDHPGA